MVQILIFDFRFSGKAKEFRDGDTADGEVPLQF